MTNLTPVEKVLAILQPLSDEQRMEVIYAIKNAYCIHCGCKEPDTGSECQCWNDE